VVAARTAALRALIALENGRSERLREALDDARPSAREQALAYELAHGVVRRERLLDYVLSGLAHRGLPRDHSMMCALRLGAYQLMFADGVPAHSAVDETVALVRNNKGFANAILRRLAERVEDRALRAMNVDASSREELALGPKRVLKLPTPLPEDRCERLAIVHSLPTFLVERWQSQHGDIALEQITEAATAIPSVWLRAVSDDTDKLRDQLARANVVTAADGPPGFLRWTDGSSPFGTAAFAAGKFLAQDPTAFDAVNAVPAAPGNTVIDFCAAPGTKTMWLATKVRPGGTVIAYDSDAGRRGRIVENIARMQVEDVVQIAEQAEDLPVADAVLVDAPCSNSGVMGRRVEVRRRIGTETFGSLAKVQRDLLRQVLRLVRPGGHLVYSTCSIDGEENDEVVAAVLADPEAAGFTLQRSQLTLPRASGVDHGGYDGGFFAVIARA